jgi:hypothetical protein
LSLGAEWDNGEAVSRTSTAGPPQAARWRLALGALIVGSGLCTWFTPVVYTPTRSAGTSATGPTATPAPAPSSPAALAALALNSWSATLQATEPVETARVQLLRDGRVIDDFPLAGGGELSYTDHLLWPASDYSYEVRAVDRGGRSLRDEVVALRTPPQTEPFPLLYASDSFWNRPIEHDAAVDPNSAGMVSRALAHYSKTASLATGDDWGRPLAYAGTASMPYDVGCSRFDCGTSVRFRIPRYARPNTGSDHHLVVVDPSSNTELDMWLATYNPKTDVWSSGGRYTTDANGWGAVCTPGAHCNGAVAAGFAAFGGIVRPEEIAQGHIDHALFLTIPLTRKGYAVCPATHTDGISDESGALPEGARIQLDPAFNVDAQGWPRWERILAHALQTYGAYVGDTGGTLGFVGEAMLDRGYDAWSLVGMSRATSLANLPWTHFRVLRLERC